MFYENDEAEVSKRFSTSFSGFVLSSFHNWLFHIKT